MSDLLRMTGMYSGMDTEAVIQQLVAAKSTKVTNLKNDQKKLEWKTSLWQDLNKRIYKLYTGTLSNMRLAGSYAKKKTTVSDPTKATITAGDGAVNGVQSLEVKQLAKSGYLTGAVISKKVNKVTGDTKLSELNVGGGTMELTVNGVKKAATITVDPDDTIDDFITKFNNQFANSTDDVRMELKDGKITVTGANGGDPAGGATFGFSTTGSTGQSVVAALGLSDMTPSDNVAGIATGKKIRLPGDTSKDETNTTLEELNIKGGKLRVQAGGKDFEIEVNKDMTVDSFISAFNKKNADEGTGLKMSVENGKISVEGPADGSSYTLSSTSDTAGNTLLQGFGLRDYGGVAQSGKITGSMISKLNPDPVSPDYALGSKLSEIDSSLVGQRLTLTVGQGADAKETTIEITAETKISELLNSLREGGVNASFDETNQRFFISSTGTGTAKEFKLEGTNNALASLGLDTSAAYENGSTATRIWAEDAQITLNGAEFTSDTNTFTINGLSITANALTTDGPISITTDTDYDGIYDMIKDFITEYNDIMNEMTKLYNADSARKYTMLSDEEKEAMSDDEVETWENTIKDSLLRRDKDLNTVMQCMIGAVNKGYDIGGETLYLVNFGVGTGSYFDTEKAERNALHIMGDSDDEKYSDEKNKLKEAIAADPDKVIELFTTMSKEMYNSLQKTMASTEYRSIYKVYDDKRMKTEYDDYTKRIKEAQQKLDDYEDKWYKKFSAMEVALSKLQSSQNSLASMLGQ
ncbi:MAG: flagellar filament capping protein FliD [Lachnospiraceae bacterium]|nr:flagellar filament capping protein FliD [Lachnospiraceae bacterium]